MPEAKKRPSCNKSKKNRLAKTPYVYCYYLSQISRLRDIVRTMHGGLSCVGCSDLLQEETNMATWSFAVAE